MSTPLEPGIKDPRHEEPHFFGANKPDNSPVAHGFCGAVLAVQGGFAQGAQEFVASVLMSYRVVFICLQSLQGLGCARLAVCRVQDGSLILSKEILIRCGMQRAVCVNFSKMSHTEQGLSPDSLCCFTEDIVLISGRNPKPHICLRVGPCNPLLLSNCDVN